MREGCPALGCWGLGVRIWGSMQHTLRLWYGCNDVWKVAVQTWVLCSAGILLLTCLGFGTLRPPWGGGLTGPVLSSAGRTSAFAQVLQCDIGRKQVLGDIVPRQHISLLRFCWLRARGAGP